MMSDKLFSLTLISCFSLFFAVPIDYSGTGEVTLNKKDEWSAKYGVGESCSGSASIELTIDITASSSEADLIIGFGTESNYFAIINPYDGNMCLPCSPVRYGTLFVTPPNGEALRTAMAGSTTAQYGATSDSLGARVALVNGEDETTNWDKLIAYPSNIAANSSPIKLVISTDQDGGTTGLTLTKNGVTTPSITFSSTFEAGKHLFLYLGIDDANTESFKLKSISKCNQCIPKVTEMCCANSGGQSKERLKNRMDTKCSNAKEKKCLSVKDKSGANPCVLVDCSSVYQDEHGEYWVASDIDNIFIRYGYNVMYAIQNNHILMYGLAIIVFGFIIFITWKNRYRCSQYKQLDDADDIKPLLSNNSV